MRATGGMFVLSGPGGVGKGTVLCRLRQRMSGLTVSVSATTRPARPGEVDGRDYHFLTDERFDELVAAGAFLEWAEFGGHRYGTPWASVEEPLAAGGRVILEIDVQGALQVRRRVTSAVLIFLAPPDEHSLADRLRARGTDSAERIAERMRIARAELAQAHRFDHVVVNDAVDTAVDRIARILEPMPAE